MTTLSVADAAREAPDRPAFVVGGQSVGYAELWHEVARRVAWLEARGAPFPSGGLLSVVGTSDLATLETVLAAIELGQPLALVHPRLTAAERAAAVALVAPALHLDAPAAASLPDEGTTARRPARVAHIDPESPLCVLFTSGTTGRPKGIVLSRRAFLASADASAENLGWVPDERWLLGLPIAHVGGLSILTRCLLARRTVVVPAAVSEGRRLEPSALADEIASQRVTLASLVPTQLEWLLSRSPAWTPPPHLRAVLLGGAAASPRLLARAADRGVPVLTTYGLTEACSQVTTQRYGTANRGALGSGLPMKNVRVRIVDGAIQVAGPTLLSAWLPPGDRPPLDPEGWLHTDDLGRLGTDGSLHVLGRRSDLIITGGENVFPAEVEGALERISCVERACVFGVEDETWGQLVAAALVLASGTEPSTAERELARHVQESLAPHRRPRRIAFVDAFEVTPAGKLDRKATLARVRTSLVPFPRT